MSLAQVVTLLIISLGRKELELLEIYNFFNDHIIIKITF
jgi:hypothetical protein